LFELFNFWIAYPWVLTHGFRKSAKVNPEQQPHFDRLGDRLEFCAIKLERSGEKLTSTSSVTEVTVFDKSVFENLELLFASKLF
jgi:hypothetical protein